ncbi:MAG: glycosyltransferase family 4 protein [Gammaproteobacteria bacterium]
MVAASLELFGGQSVQAAALAERLRAEGYAVDWIPINPRFPKPLRWLRRIPYLRTLANALLYLPSLAGLRKADVVHVFSASYFSFLLGPAPALLAARLMGKRVILNYHSGEAEDHLARWGLLVHPWLKLAHEIVVPSQFLCEVFARFGYATRVIANIIDTSAFDFRERSPLRPRLLSTRNLESHYRVEVVVRAFALIKKRYPEATLLVAGYGSEEQNLRRLVKELETEGVTFYGRYLPSTAPRLYANADIFVNASVIDNQPVSVLEAFASGLPIVSTATGDIGAMLEGGRLGIIVPPDDPEAMAGAVETLIENQRQSMHMARQAYRSLKRFSWEQVRDDWSEVYGGQLRKGAVS